MQERDFLDGGGVSDGDVALVEAWVNDGKTDCPSLPDAVGGDDLPVADPGAVADPGSSAPTCTSGQYWAQQEEESERMRPGGNCIACHDRVREPGDDSPPFLSIAGTVMGGLGDLDNCLGVADVEVEITDASGQSRVLRTNTSGNFLVREKDWSPVVPYTVRLQYEGRQRVMVGAKSDRNCMNCHTQDG